MKNIINVKIFIYVSAAVILIIASCHFDENEARRKTNYDTDTKQAEFYLPDSVAKFIDNEIDRICSEGGLHQCIAVYHNRIPGYDNFYINRFFSLDFLKRNPVKLLEKRKCSFVVLYTGAEDNFRVFGMDSLSANVESYLTQNLISVNYDYPIINFKYNSTNGRLLFASPVKQNPFLRQLPEVGGVKIHPPS